MTQEASMGLGRDTEWEGGDCIYLHSLMFSPLKFTRSSTDPSNYIILWTRHANAQTARVNIHHMDNAGWDDGANFSRFIQTTACYLYSVCAVYCIKI